MGDLYISMAACCFSIGRWKDFLLYFYKGGDVSGPARSMSTSLGLNHI